MDAEKWGIKVRKEDVEEEVLCWTCNMECLYLACVAIGCCKVVQFLQPLIQSICAKLLGLEYKWSSLGKWAVVTGGTDGIGKAYAEKLASRGFNVCIISRNVEKLRIVAKDIGEKYHVSTCTIHADFTDDPSIYQAIASNLDELHGGIGVLVNNVGMSYRNPEYFHAIEGGEKVIRDMISTNVIACTMMMRLVLPRMLDHGRGVIVNISSLTAIYPMPLLTVYAACKAYVDHLSRAVHYEYRDRGIYVQSLLPGYVATKMSHRRTRLEVPTPEAFVSSALKTIGIESYSYGYWAHKIRGFVHEWLKANMPARVNLAMSMYFMKKAREGYFRKLRIKMKKEGQTANCDVVESPIVQRDGSVTC